LASDKNSVDRNRISKGNKQLVTIGSEYNSKINFVLDKYVLETLQSIAFCLI